MPLLPSFIENKEIEKIKFKRGIFHFGSLKTLFLYTEDYYKDYFEELYRIWIEEVPPNFSEKDVDAIIYIFKSEKAFSPKYHFRENPVFYHDKESDWYQIRSDFADAYILNSITPAKIYIPINPEAGTPEPLLNFLLSVFNKVLFIFGMLHVHAAAIRHKGTTCLFIGDKGVGKTTISLWFANLGSTILGEDHIMVKKVDGTFLASGCDNIMRVTKKTEEKFFENELPITPSLFAGVPKKEIELSDYFKSSPYVDETVNLIFFPSVKDKFSIKRIEKSFALLYFLERIQPRNRFADNNDAVKLMSFLGDFIETVDIYSLELSENINDLEQLVDFIESRRKHNDRI